MKENKDSNQMRLGLKYSILLCSLLCVLWLMPQRADAAAYRAVYGSGTAAERTVNGYRFQISNSQISTTRAGVKKVLASSTGLGYTVITNGQTVFYFKHNGTTATVYQIQANGKNGKKLFSCKSRDYFTLAGYYGSKVYYIKQLDPGTLCSYNLKTKKASKLAANVTSADQSGKYFVLTPYTGAITGTVHLRIYDAVKGTIKTVSKKMAGYRILNGKLYYAEYVKCDMAGGRNVLTVKRINLNGTGKKTLIAKLKAGYITEFRSTYVKYRSYDFKMKNYKY